MQIQQTVNKLQSYSDARLARLQQAIYGIAPSAAGVAQVPGADQASQVGGFFVKPTEWS